MDLFVAPPALVLFIAIGGEVVLHLWNWLLPALFGWPQITFWQALGTAGSLPDSVRRALAAHGSHRSRSRRVSAECWERMTPEEREKFRHGSRAGCGGFAAPAGESKEPA